MCPRPTLAAVLAGLALLPAAAQALDKDAKKWLDDVRPLILPDEEKQYRELKDKADVAEFQKIFWARRDPDLETPHNEFQVEYDKQRADIDVKYKTGGKAGSLNDCGRVAILLGEPNEVKKEDGGGQTWTFRDRPGQTFQGGQALITFDQACLLPQGNKAGDPLNQVAGRRIVNPNLSYRVGTDGKIVKLVEQLPKPTPAQALIKTPRQDFASEITTEMVLRTTGGTYVAGLLKGDAAALTQVDAGGKKQTRVQVVTQVADATGKKQREPEREALADVGADGKFVVSYGLALRPGKYVLSVGALDAKGNKGSVATMPLDVPDLSATDALSMSSVMVLKDLQEIPTPEPTDPLSAFLLGKTRLVPTFKNTFAPEDAVILMAAVYGAKVDETTGKAAINVKFVIMKDGKKIAEAPPQTFETENATPSVGPVPLGKYGPGKFVAQVTATDTLTKAEKKEETAFEVVAAAK